MGVEEYISQQLKVHFMKALIWPVFLYGADSWTIKISDANRIISFEMWCWRKMIDVQWKKHRRDDSILNQVGMNRVPMAKLAHMKFMYFGHVMRGSAGELALMVTEGVMEGIRGEERCSEETVAGQHPGIKWANLPGVQGAGPVAERMEINVLEVVFVCHGTSADVPM